MRNRIIPIATMQAAGQPQPAHIARLATGIPTLDMALEDGLPLGNIVEISGKAHAGKTTLALQILGHRFGSSTLQSQRAGLRAVYVSGTTLPPAHYLEACGIDTSALDMPHPKDTASLESALMTANEALARGNTVMVLDPLPAFPTRDELDAGGENGNRRAVRARIFDAAYAVACAHLRQRPHSLLVIVNQERYNTGVLFGNPWEPTLHQVTDHFQVRLHLARVQAMKQEGEIVGSRIRVRVKKNAGSRPFTEATFDILHHSGPDFWGNVLDLALVQGIISKVNGCYEVDGVQVGRTRAQVRARLVQTQDERQRIIAQLELPQLTWCDGPVAGEE